MDAYWLLVTVLALYSFSGLFRGNADLEIGELLKEVRWLRKDVETLKNIAMELKTTDSAQSREGKESETKLTGGES